MNFLFIQSAEMTFLSKYLKFFTRLSSGNINDDPLAKIILKIEEEKFENSKNLVIDTQNEINNIKNHLERSFAYYYLGKVFYKRSLWSEGIYIIDKALEYSDNDGFNTILKYRKASLLEEIGNYKLCRLVLDEIKSVEDPFIQFYYHYLNSLLFRYNFEIEQARDSLVESWKNWKKVSDEKNFGIMEQAAILLRESSTLDPEMNFFMTSVKNMASILRSVDEKLPGSETDLQEDKLEYVVNYLSILIKLCSNKTGNLTDTTNINNLEYQYIRLLIQQSIIYPNKRAENQILANSYLDYLKDQWNTDTSSKRDRGYYHMLIAQYDDVFQKQTDPDMDINDHYQLAIQNFEDILYYRGIIVATRHYSDFLNSRQFYYLSAEQCLRCLEYNKITGSDIGILFAYGKLALIYSDILRDNPNHKFAQDNMKESINKFNDSYDLLCISKENKIRMLDHLKKEIDEISMNISDQFKTDVFHEYGKKLNEMKVYPKIKNSPTFKEFYKIAGQNQIPILIIGESGVGKEIVAEEIFNSSNRKNKTFLKFNCALFQNTNTLQSVLFGSTAGSYTGANKDQKGIFKTADGGTVFLDEVGELPPDAQTALLRFLSTGEIQPLGGEVIPVDVRTIFATNKNLAKMVDENLFREDLFYRINTITLHVPSLRDHKKDIPELIDIFINDVTKKNKTSSVQVLKKSNPEQGEFKANPMGLGEIDPIEIRFEQKLIENLIKLDYRKNNVRELKGLVERIMAFCKKYAENGVIKYSTAGWIIETHKQEYYSYPKECTDETKPDKKGRNIKFSKEKIELLVKKAKYLLSGPDSEIYIKSKSKLIDAIGISRGSFYRNPELKRLMGEVLKKYYI